jgi:hypothetical protein
MHAINARRKSSGIFVGFPVLGGHVVFRHFPRRYFSNVRRRGVFNTLNSIGLESVSFFHQFLNALRIRISDIG